MCDVPWYKIEKILVVDSFKCILGYIILGWIFILVFSFRSVEAATKVKSQPASFPQRIRTMPKKLSDTTPLKVSEH